MMSAEVLLELVLKIGILLVLGYAMRKKGLINDDFQARLSQMLLNVIIPFTVISAGNTAYDNRLGLNLLVVAGFTLAYYIIAIPLCTLLSKVLPLGQGTRSTFVNLIVYGNVGFIGYPIVLALYGGEGLLYAVVMNLGFFPFLFTHGIKVVGGRSLSPRRLLTDVTILTCIGGILLFILPIKIPGVLLSTIDLVGGMAAPFSMFIIGSALAKIKLGSLFSSGWAWLAVLVRQVAFPLILAGIFVLAGAKGIMPSVCVMLTGLPAASTNVIFASRYGHDEEFATRTVSLGMLLMLATMPLCAFLCSMLFF